MGSGEAGADALGVAGGDRLFDSSLANVWPATQSQVYGELGELASAGLLEVAAEGPRGRKEYTITDRGLAERLEASVDRGEDRISVHGRLALEYGLRLTAMRQEWAEWARGQVAELG
ncbi:hypothetical protein ACWERV_02290 [Streptomyces sp. NPDC004031]